MRRATLVLAYLTFVGCEEGSAGMLPKDAGPPDAGQDAGQVCTIDGGIFTIGWFNPENACQICALPDLTVWTPANEGLGCAADHTCHRGECAPECLIDGGRFTSGSKNPQDLGQCCNPFIASNAWQERFTVGPNIDVYAGAQFPAAADFDRDGRPDVAVIARIDGGPAVVIMHNDGAFASTTLASYLLPESAAPLGLTVADLDGDGAPDVLVADGAGAVELLRNHGDGTLEPAIVVPLSECADGVVGMQDFLAPGRMAVAVITSSPTFDGGGEVLLFDVQTDGGPSLVPVAGQSTEPGPFSLTPVPATLGRPSLVFRTYGPVNTNGVFEGNDVQEAMVASDLALSVSNPISDEGFSDPASINGLAVGDVNGDGLPDIVAANFYEKSLGVSAGDGHGGFGPWVRTPLIAEADGPPVLADFDGSGRLAAVVAADGIMSVMWTNADGTLPAAEATTSFGVIECQILTAADFNGDGAVDLACTTYGPSAVQILFNSCP